MLCKKIYSLIIILLLVNFSFAEKLEDLVATDYVNDFAGVLTVEQELELSKTLGDLEKAKGYQVAVAIVKNMDGDYIEHYAVKLFEQWGIGKAGSDQTSDQGVLFLVSIEDRQMRIEVGYGLESILTDGITRNILDNGVKPEFRNENYFGGIKLGIDDMVYVLNGGEMAEVASENNSDTDWFSIIMFILVFGVNILGWLFAIMARTKSWWLGGVVTFVIGGAILLFLGFTVVNNLILFIFTLTGFIFDYFISRNYKYWQSKIAMGATGKNSPAWWAGGTWGPGSGGFGGSSSGSGFGGFGGGSSGGGGSSSSW